MGVSIYANGSSYSFDMGYFGFFSLRANIAKCLDEEFGKNYEALGTRHTEQDFTNNDRIANAIIEEKHLDADVIDFLYQSDCEGKISYRTCGKIHSLIENRDFGDTGFRYQTQRHNDWQEFKEFLKECYSKRRNMLWN